MFDSKDKLHFNIIKEIASRSENANAIEKLVLKYDLDECQKDHLYGLLTGNKIKFSFDFFTRRMREIGIVKGFDNEIYDVVNILFFSREYRTIACEYVKAFEKKYDGLIPNSLERIYFYNKDNE